MVGHGCTGEIFGSSPVAKGLVCRGYAPAWLSPGGLSVAAGLSLRHPDEKMLRQRPEPTQPPQSLPIAFGGAVPGLVVDAVEGLIADILRLPEVHAKREPANQGSQGLEALEPFEPNGVGGKLAGCRLEPFAEGVSERPFVKGHVLESRLPEQLFDPTQIELVVLQRPVEAGVEDELGCR